MIKKEYMYSRDSKKKVRVFILEVAPKDDGYVIQRSSGLLTGKHTIQPEKEVMKGKVKRTVEEQVELEAKSILSKQADKGYVSLRKLVDAEVYDLIDPMDHELIDSLLSKEKKDAQGASKPMLAQDAHKTKKDGTRVKDVKWFERAWWVSQKIDGVRTLGTLKVDENGADYIEFTSRSGKPYGPAVRNFDRDPELIQFMKDNNCEIDGEIYHHGWHLNKINGCAAKKTYEPERHDPLSFYMFDIAKEDMDATARVKILNKLHFKNNKIVVLHHTHCISYKEIMQLHDGWVLGGFEGAMGRTATGMYEFGKRSNEIWKFKVFEDDEFEIVGIVEGARPEDMCFAMMTDDHKPFNCDIIGGADMVAYYRAIIDDLKGKKGTVKYFGWTSKGLPNIAKFKCVKEDD